MKSVILYLSLFISLNALAQMRFEPCHWKKMYDENPNWSPEWDVGVVMGRTFRKKDICMPMTTRMIWEQKMFVHNLNQHQLNYVHTFTGEAWYREDLDYLVLVGSPMTYQGKDQLYGATGTAVQCKDGSCRHVVHYPRITMNQLMGRWTSNWGLARPAVEIQGEFLPEVFTAQSNDYEYRQGSEYYKPDPVNLDNTTLAQHVLVDYKNIIKAMTTHTPYHFSVQYNGNNEVDDTTHDSGKVKFALYFGCPTEASIEDTLDSSNDKYLFNGAVPGVADFSLIVNLKNYPQEDNDMQITWEVPEKAGSDLNYNRTGPSARIIYTRLPRNNKDFGETLIKAKVKVAGCADLEASKKVKLFFPRDARNSPDVSVPNWYYYWSQTVASVDLVAGQDYVYKDDCTHPEQGTYRPTQVISSNGKEYHRIEKLSYVCNLANMVNPFTYTPVKNIGDFKNIDAFAVLLQRANQYWLSYTYHWLDHQLGWPVEVDLNNPALTDVDRDYLPDNREVELGYNPTMLNTHGTVINGMVYDDLAHLSSSLAELLWFRGAANRQDWAKPGNQWE